MKYKHFRRFLLPLALLIALFTFLLPMASRTQTFAQDAQNRWAGTVSDENGAPLAATVTINGVQVQADADGSFELDVPSADDERYVINAELFGYVPVSQIHVGAAIETLALTLKQAERFEIDPEQEASLEDERGTRISIPAGSLVDADGNPPTGTLQLLLYTYDLTQEAMPGDMGALDSEGQPVALESAGVFYARFTDAEGNEYNLAPEARAEISIPVDPDLSLNTIPLWSYDETQGLWIEEGEAAQAAGRYTGEVSHFSYWNFDAKWSTPACIRLTVDPAYLASNSPILMKAVLYSPSRVVYLTINSTTNVLYNLPPNANVDFFTGPPSYSTLYATVNTGAPWGGTSIPPRPYDDCDGELDIDGLEPGAVHGTKFLDLDGDGMQDPNEPGIPGWPIRITDDSGTVISDTTTNSQGEYWFMDLNPGAYNVMEDVLPGWVQTSPPTVKHTYEITAGQVITEAHFGNTAACEDPESDSCEAGRQDDFDGSDGPEPASPSPELLAFLQSCPGNPQTQFDQPAAGRCFGHTFDKDSGDSCLSHDCLIVGATVTIHLKATGNDSPDDIIGFMQNGVYVWATEIANLPEAGGTWNNGQEAIFTLDLANLPPDAYGVTNILATLQDGDLDVFVLEDTMVDYVTLDVEYCCDCKPGQIHGMKWNDLDGDGEKDSNEPGLEDWPITLTDADGNILTTTTDAEGNYWFMGLPSGTYTVSEVLQDGWTQTFPSAPGTHTVTLQEGQVVENIDFGNTKQGAIHGMKWNDLDGDGEKDSNEPGLEDWTITLIDADGNILTTTTDAEGNYWFMPLAAGTYTVTEVQQDGWTQTFPSAPGTHTVTLQDGQVVENIDFGNTEAGAIHGMKWNDLNGDGEKDSDEPGLEGWVITLTDADGNILTTTTDVDGNYWFMPLAAGTYTVTEVQQDGWTQTFPSAPGTHTVRLQDGQVVENIDFGNTEAGAIHGMKWNDLNGNGEKDEGEPGLRRWIITLTDADGNVFTTTTDGDGNYWFMPLAAGTYTVTEVQQDGWTQTFPSAPGTHTVTLQEGQVVENIDFGNTKAGEIHGMKWHDLNGNGEKDSGEPGLEGWTITLTDTNGNVLTTTTDVDGNYWFMGLPSGTYTVSEVLQDGWTQTFPTDPGTHTVRLRAGQVVENIDFGNVEGGAIHGMKWHDLNGNGEKDEGEPGLRRWEITLIDSSGNIFTTTTDAEGNYWFMGLPSGTYTVSEVLQDGWTQTFPVSGTHSVVLAKGQVVENIDFGNARPSEIHGMKFHDLNGNGEKDDGEPGLEGWTITLTDTNGNLLTTTTDVDGNYWFMGLPSGTYTVSEVLQDGWTQTFPVSGTHSVVLAKGQVVENIDFGNARPGEIHGMKFHDENGNGEKDDGEPGLEGWTILLEDENGNVISTVTDDEGNYWFMDLPPGTYTLAEFFEEPGWVWQQTTPQGTHTVEVGAGEVVENVDFGNWQEGKDDYCSIKWDNQFVDQEPMEIKVKIRNTSDTPEKAYSVQMIGLPAGTLGSNADGPTTFDILTPLPITVDPNQTGAVGVNLHYPPSFANGDPGPALYQAIVTNETTGTSFGCKAALWPVRDVQPVPVETDTVELRVGEPRNLGFRLRNRGQRGRRIGWIARAMSQGMSGESPIVRLGRSRATGPISGELTLEAGESTTLTLTAEFLEHAPLGVTDILLELDIDEDGIMDVIVSSVIRSVEEEPTVEEAANVLYLPIVTKP